VKFPAILLVLLLGPLYCSAQAPTFSKASPSARLEQLRLYRSKGNTAAKNQATGKMTMLTQAQVADTCPAGSQAAAPTPQDITAYVDKFGANLNVLGSFGDAGAKGIPSAQNSIQPEALGQVEFESEHFGFDWARCSNLTISHRPTFSFGGKIGLVPALVMENLSTSSTTPLMNPKNRPMFQDAFGWNLTARINVATSHFSQFDAFSTLGEDYLLSQVTSFKQGDDTITATPVSNNVGQSALYWETGVQWKYLNTDIINAYNNKTDILNPPFDISTGYRQDGRFKGVGDLAGFLNPEKYIFLRFTVGLDKIVNWSGDQVLPGKGYTFKFGIDYERPIGDGNMPTATRYYVSANIDVMKIFKPSATQ
jgi:hypothetical protein